MKRILCLIGMIIISGCTTMKPVDVSQSRDEVVSAIKVNEKIVVQTVSDQKFEMVVKEVTETDIIGLERTVALSDIKELSVSQFSTGKTIGAAVGAYVAAAIVGIMVLVNSI